MPYLLFTPSSAGSTKTTPLLLWLHGKGGCTGSEPTGLPSIIRSWKSEGFNAYIVCPHLTGAWANKTGSSWANPSAEKLLNDLLDKIIEEYNIDTNHIVVAGHSLGGTGAQYVAQHMSDRISKSVVLAGYGFNSDPSKIKIPIKGYVGSGDTGKAGDRSAYGYMSSTFEAAVGEENLQVIKGGGHSDSRTTAFSQDDGSFVGIGRK